MDKELLEAIGKMLDDRDNRLKEHLKADMSAMMDEKIAPLKSELSAMIDEKIAPLQAEISGLKEETRHLTADIAGLKEETRHIRVLVEAHDKKFQLIQEAQAETAAKFSQLDRMEQTLEDVKSEVEVMRDVMQFHTKEITTLKAVSP